MATKQISRYPSTKFHKQAKSTFASEIYGTVHTPQHLFSSSFRIVNSYTRQLPAKKPVKKAKKKQIKIFKKKQKKTKYRI